MKDRIKHLRKEVLNMTQQRFAEELEMSKTTIEKYEYGSREVPDRTIKDICRKFNVSYDWLMYGDGEIFADDTSETMELIEELMPGSTEFQKKVLAYFAKMPEEYWAVMEKIIQDIKKES